MVIDVYLKYFIKELLRVSYFRNINERIFLDMSVPFHVDTFDWQLVNSLGMLATFHVQCDWQLENSIPCTHFDWQFVNNTSACKIPRYAQHGQLRNVYYIPSCPIYTFWLTSYTLVWRAVGESGVFPTLFLPDHFLIWHAVGESVLGNPGPLPFISLWIWCARAVEESGLIHVLFLSYYFEYEMP